MYQVWTTVFYRKNQHQLIRKRLLSIFLLSRLNMDIVLKFDNDFSFTERFNEIQWVYTTYHSFDENSWFRELNVYDYGICDLELIRKDNKPFSYLKHEYNIEDEGLSDNIKEVNIDKPNDAEISKYIDNKPDLDAYSAYHDNMYPVVGVGGTFNLLHLGHKLLLTLSYLLAKDRLDVGVTTSSLLIKKSDSEMIEGTKTRISNIHTFLSRSKKGIDFGFFVLRHPMECWDAPFNALVVSEETQKAIPLFNKMRKEDGISELEEVLLRNVVFANEADKHSSSKLRKQIALQFEDNEDYLYLKKKFIDSMVFLLNHKKQEETEKYGKLEEYRRYDKIERFDLGLISLENELEKEFKKIAVKYTERTRYYHTLTHINDCITKLYKLFSSKVDETDFHIMAIALFYHDVIYDAKASDNEKASALFFSVFAKKMKIKDEYAKLIENLIIHTEKHDIPIDCNKPVLYQILNDIDLSILAEELDTYIQYAINIRKEYSFVPLEEYKKRRKDVLLSLRNKSPIFFNKVFKEEYVYRNVDYEIENMLDKLE